MGVVRKFYLRQINLCIYSQSQSRPNLERQPRCFREVAESFVRRDGYSSCS